jgi:beta-phosphoglucomutase-like phosphatase (HAD superfamily)
VAVGHCHLVTKGQVGTSLAALDLGRDPTIVDGSSVEHAKPAPDLLLAAAAALEQAPADCWCIGDSTWDMRAATAAGMMSVGVTAGAAVPAEALREAGAVLVTDTLMELQAELHRRRGGSV